MEAGRRCTGHLGESGVRNIRSPGELCGAESRRLLGHAVQFLSLDAAEYSRRTLAGGADDDEVTEALEQILDETARILAGLDDPVDRGERGGSIPGTERVDHFVQERTVRVAEQRDCPLVPNRRPFRTGDELVEQGEGVAHRTASGAHDEWEHSGLHLHLLAHAEGLHVFEHLGGRHQPEWVVMSARADRTDDLLRLRRREDELHVLRRLLHDLEQRVEPLRGHHVRLVQDEDLVAIPRRGEHGPLAQVPRVVDTIVARGIDLHDIHRPAAISAQLDAARTDAARRVGRSLGAVKTAGEDAGGRRLAAPAGATE